MEGKSFFQTILGVVNVLFLGILLFGAGWAYFKSDKSAKLAFSKDKFQAVVTNQKELYFGRVVSDYGEYVVLKDAYYLVTGEDEGLGAGKYRLTRLDKGIQTPESQLTFIKVNVAYLENLDSNGKLAMALKQAIDNNQPAVELEL